MFIHSKQFNIRFNRILGNTRYFSRLGVSVQLQNALKYQLKYTAPLDVQEQAIPLIKNGSNCIIVAQTGSGKTLSYLLPILDSLQTSNKSDTIPIKNKNIFMKISPEALIVVPTRELATQLTMLIEKLSPQTIVSFVPPSEGTPLSKLVTPRVAITTPGALSAFLLMGKPKSTLNLREFMQKTRYTNNIAVCFNVVGLLW